ncbi:uncharacterized protein LOC589352 isoform X1 [Strongylocentrotus purpuratus]|uniref:Uncharacterized protein n=1 Tax=Strongylocentrotus purpuratus TaxID=7668 RepID=A0A7M7HHG2_STRPU|nr:uncharacterized protein LOC589352 isoform X1 [Strongylocentrotus purpuratus]XP_011668547.2 uncharacterized protein LOC589352 isoform X1 [Strongylocentrotus purpuratus]
MSLTKFTLPGKDCRCIVYEGKVCKIKTLMPPLTDGTIGDYIDNKTLQEELEDIIRAVLRIPHSVDPVTLRTEHLFVQPEKKEWNLPHKVEFKQPGQTLIALPYTYVLNLQLYAAKKETLEEPQIQEEDMESNKRKAERSSSPSKSTEQSKRPKRKLIQEGPISSSSSPRRSNRRMAPSRGSASSSNKPGYILRKRALRVTTSNNTSNNSNMLQRGGSHTIPPDDKRLDEAGMLDGWDEQTGRRNRDRIDIERQKRERSPELESGFSRLVQGKAAVGPERFPRANESADRDQSHVECTGDQGPMPARPSDGGAARVGVPGHPGRERVEQHVLQEQLRLQQMASPVGDAKAEEQPNDRGGLIHNMFDCDASEEVLLSRLKKDQDICPFKTGAAIPSVFLSPLPKFQLEGLAFI